MDGSPGEVDHQVVDVAVVPAEVLDAPPGQALGHLLGPHVGRVHDHHVPAAAGGTPGAWRASTKQGKARPTEENLRASSPTSARSASERGPGTGVAQLVADHLVLDRRDLGPELLLVVARRGEPAIMHPDQPWLVEEGKAASGVLDLDPVDEVDERVGHDSAELQVGQRVGIDPSGQVEHQGKP